MMKSILLSSVLCLTLFYSCDKCKNVTGKLPQYDASKLQLGNSYEASGQYATMKRINDSVCMLQYVSNKKTYSFYYKITNNGTYNKDFYKQP